MNAHANAHEIRMLAAELGFARCGVAPAAPTPNAHHYRSWLAAGYAGSMDYLRRNVPMREDASRLLPGARSVICAAVSYNRSDDPPSIGHEPSGKVARYARGRNYHPVLLGMLRTLVQRLEARNAAPFESRICVDTAPILERDLAAAAGLGWIGKNTLLMHETFGSYLLLGEILTTLDIEPDAPATDHCGSCTRCLDACPTQAFPRPYELDASRCISYLTIEHRGDIDPLRAAKMGDWVFGCDICQEVCPHNVHAPPGVQPELMERLLPARVPLAPLTELTAGGYRRLTRGTAATRAGARMWRRNAAIALQNAAQSEPADE